MPKFGPIKRYGLIRYFTELGFDGPFSGGKHQFMIKGKLTIRIPNPHQSDISKELLQKILKQANISKITWEKL
ncbi:MAG: type II toxin-antitoxin system HicA family toxin [Candidatus Humimicrobiaceae bacterium]